MSAMFQALRLRESPLNGVYGNYSHWLTRRRTASPDQGFLCGAIEALAGTSLRTSQFFAALSAA